MIGKGTCIFFYFGIVEHVFSFSKLLFFCHHPFAWLYPDLSVGNGSYTLCSNFHDCKYTGGIRAQWISECQFHSHWENYEFKFSLLTELIITNCPNLKKFCSGKLNIPLLEKVTMWEEKKNFKAHMDLKILISLLYFQPILLILSHFTRLISLRVENVF